MNGSVEYKMELLANSSDPTDRDQTLKFYQSRFIKQDEKHEKNPLISWERKTAAEILATNYPPLQWIIPGIIPEGLTKIDGSPKVGKSWLALHLATSVSSGGCFMGSIDVEQREVLYLALEDSYPRIKDRIIKQGGYANDKLFIETPKSWKGGIVALKSYVKEFPATGLIIIDTLFKFFPLEDSNEYSKTYKPLSTIQEIAAETRIPILLIHHTRKGANNNTGENWADEGMGSQGFNGAVDTIILLQKKDGKNEGSIRIKGRDIEEKSYDITFDKDICTWRIIGESDVVTKSDPKAQSEVLSLLEKAGPEGMTPAEIQKALNISPSATSNRLKAIEGKTKKANGRYIISHFHDVSQMNKSENMNFTFSHSLRKNEKMKLEEELVIY